MCIRDSAYSVHDDVQIASLKNYGAIYATQHYINEHVVYCLEHTMNSPGIKAVSYTHLDVYKRQGQQKASGRGQRRGHAIQLAKKTGKNE